jgi:hypothetical protein
MPQRSNAVYSCRYNYGLTKKPIVENIDNNIV